MDPAVGMVCVVLEVDALRRVECGVGTGSAEQRAALRLPCGGRGYLPTGILVVVVEDQRFVAGQIARFSGMFGSGGRA